MHVKFNTTEDDGRVIAGIVTRAMKLKLGASRMDVHMDLSATHCNGNPLRLDDLLAADDFNFTHDIAGIRRHLNRDTGKLEDGFSPRFTLREKRAA